MKASPPCCRRSIVDRHPQRHGRSAWLFAVETTSKPATQVTTKRGAIVELEELRRWRSAVERGRDGLRRRLVHGHGTFDIGIGEVGSADDRLDRAP